MGGNVVVVVVVVVLAALVVVVSAAPQSRANLQTVAWSDSRHVDLYYCTVDSRQSTVS